MSGMGRWDRLRVSTATSKVEHRGQGLSLMAAGRSLRVDLLGHLGVALRTLQGTLMFCGFPLWRLTLVRLAPGLVPPTLLRQCLMHRQIS